LLVLAVTVPFLNKPFHIDDTFVLHVTDNILRSFWDPFTGEIDWFGYELEVWKATTNPPLLSYYLAPFAWLSDYSEIVLHTSMLLFFLLLAFAMQFLAGRFVSAGYWPLLFMITSVAVVVSGNVMRDVPGAALGVAGVACFIGGSDRDSKGLLALGAVLAGLAILTKYSAAVVLPVMAFYVLCRGKINHLGWLLLSFLVVGAWCLHNWLMYGQVHMLYLFLERRSTGSALWQDKLFGALTVLGSSCLLFPALLAETLRRRLWLLLAVNVVLVAGTVFGIGRFLGIEPDFEYLFWAVAGVLAFSIPVLAVLLQKNWSRDSLFLVVWCAGVVGFSIVMVPFQAVRHLIPALPPLLLLSFRYLATSEEFWFRGRRYLLIFLLMIQLAIAGIVHLADYEYAASYRQFAERVSEDGRSFWYVGHWGWKFYADRAGFRELHRDGPYPSSGDLLLWPKKVHIGRVFQNGLGLPDRLQLVSEDIYEGTIPVRTMDGDCAAGFYSIGRGNLPFRVFPGGPVEVMRVYRVREVESPKP